MSYLFLLLALLSVQSRAGASQQAARTSRIAGVVVDAVTNAPVPQAEVSIFLESEEIRIKTGADGRFRFEPLRAAKYQLYADAPGYIREGYNQHGSFFTGIAVGTGFDSEHLIFRLHPQGVIHGRVSDEHGDPVRNAAVHLFVSENSGARGQGSVQAQTQTDDLGEYRFAHLPAGKYRIAVQTRPWYAQPGLNFQPEQRTQGFRVLSRKPDPVLDVVYPVTFFPGVTDPRAAADLPVPAGSTEEANIQLQAVPAIHLRLTNLPFDQNGVTIGASQRVGNVQAGIPIVIAQITPEEYEVAGLPPGATTLEITRNGEQQQVPRTINADISDNDTLNAAASFANLSGRVIAGQAITGFEQARLLLVGTGNQTVSAMLHNDGTFSLAGLQTGTYRISLDGGAGDQFIQSLSASGARVSGRQITIDRSGEVQLTITMGAGFAQVTGVARLDDQAVDGIMVLAVPSSGENREEDSRMDQSDSDGTFSLVNLIPGKYFLVAIRDGWDLDWHDPQVLKPYLERAQTLQLARGESKSVTVEVQAGGKPARSQ
jgi:hypothetical protein